MQEKIWYTILDSRHEDADWRELGSYNKKEACNICLSLNNEYETDNEKRPFYIAEIKETLVDKYDEYGNEID